MTRFLKPLLYFNLVLVLGGSLNGCSWWHESVGGTIKDYGHMKSYNPEVIPVQYCYRTRGAPDCYREPQMGQESRLISQPKIRTKTNTDTVSSDVAADAAKVATPSQTPAPEPMMSSNEVAPVDAPIPLSK